MTAAARVAFNAAAYLGLAKKLTSPGPASSSRQPRRSASSPSVTVSAGQAHARANGHAKPAWVSRARNRRPIEEGDQPFEPQPLGNLADARFAHFGFERREYPQLRERIARAQVPLDAVEPLTRPSHRQVVPNHPERQVIGRDIRPRQDDQDCREREEGAVDRQPAPVPVVILTETGAEHLEGCIWRHVDWIPGDGGLLASEVPEQPLFGDAFGNPPQRRPFEALVAREAVCFVGGRLVTAPALAFGLCQRLTKAMHQAFEEPARGL